MTAPKFPNNNNRKEVPTDMTQMRSDGVPDTARFTPFMRYPLPPLATPENSEVGVFNGRYTLPSPTTSRPTTYSRATTVSSTIADYFMLNQWKHRTKVAAVLRAQDMHCRMQAGDGALSDTDMALAAAYREYERAVAEGKAGAINTAIDLIDDLAGGADAKELGGAVHDWLAELDTGRALLHQIPAQFQPYAVAYQRALHQAGLVPVGQYTERVVLNDRGKETIAGRIDRILRVVDTDELVLGDVKTSKSLDLALMEYAIQFSIYGYATLMLSPDERTWEPMPDINQDYCVCIHVPSDQPERSQVVPFDLYAGGEGLITAIEVREQRKEIPKRVRSHTIPTPSAKSMRYVAARQALQSMSEPDEAGNIREAFEDVWTDDLNEFGATCYELLFATSNEEN